MALDDKDPALEPEDTTTAYPQAGADGNADDVAAEGTEPEGEPAAEGGAASDEYELVVEGEQPADKTIDEKAAGQALARMRQENAALRAENAEIKRRTAVMPTKVEDPGPKPDMTEIMRKHDFDEVKAAKAYEAALDEWQGKVQAKASADTTTANAQKAWEQTWQQKKGAFEQAETQLKTQLPSYAAARDVVAKAFSPLQQDVLVHVAEGRAPLVIALLGRDPEKLKELAAMEDPILLGARIAKLEGKITMKKTNAPPPERGRVRGNGPPSGAVDSTLERLRAEAGKTGDLSKVSKYLRDKREKTSK